MKRGLSKHLIGLLTVLAITQLPISCGPIGNDDVLYKIVGIRALAGKVTNVHPFRFELHDFDLAVGDDTLLIDEFGLQLQVDSIIEVAYQPQPKLFLSSAMAAPSEYRPHESSIVELISIYSNDTFFTDSQVYAPGATLINEFSLIDYRGNILDILDATKHGKLWFEEGAHLNLMISGKISHVIHQQLSIRLTLADGSEVEATTQKILLKPR